MTPEERAAWAHALIADWPPPPREVVDLFVRSLIAVAAGDTPGIRESRTHVVDSPRAAA